MDTTTNSEHDGDSNKASSVVVPDIYRHKVWIWYSDGQVPCWVPAELGQLTDQFRDMPDVREWQYMIRLDEPVNKWEPPHPQTGLTSPTRSRNSKIGYMCAVDFTHHLGNDSQPQKVYVSYEDLKAKRKCLEQCGALEVEVTIKKVLSEGHGT